jgi:hypothetical protein
VPDPTLLANWIPNPSPDWRTSPTPFIALMVLGFVVAVAGHIMKLRVMIAGGIAAIFLATFLLPLLVYLGKG